MTKAQRLLETAIGQLGCGESDCDNGGEQIAEYFRKPYKAGKDYGNWCAAVVSSWLEDSLCGVPRSNGAKRVCRNVGKAGRFVAKPVLFKEPVWLEPQPDPGDVIAWHRGPGNEPSSWWRDWRGHVEIVKSYDAVTDTLITIGGNSGRFPSKVAMRTYRDGRWRRKLYGIARLD